MIRFAEAGEAGEAGDAGGPAGVAGAVGAAGGESVLVLDMDGVVAGAVRLGPARDEPGMQTGEVAVLVVPAEGLPPRLLEAAADELRWAGFGEGVAWVPEGEAQSRRAFEQAGWTADGGERPQLDGGGAIRQVRYRRLLPASPYGLRLDRAAPDDVDDLLRLYDDLARWMVAGGIEQWRPGELTAGRARHYIVDGDVVLLRFGDELVGSVAITWMDPFGWDDRVGVAGYVHQLMIARSLAGQGLGRRLLQRAERRIAEAGLSRARLDCVATNDVLRRYYERAGYRYVRDTDYGGRTDLRPGALYEKAVTPSWERPPGPLTPPGPTA